MRAKTKLCGDPVREGLRAKGEEHEGYMMYQYVIKGGRRVGKKER